MAAQASFCLTWSQSWWGFSILLVILSASLRIIIVCQNLTFSFEDNYNIHYTPGIYAEGYIVFVLLFVLSYVGLFLCASIMFVEFSFFTVAWKFLKWGISHEPLIRKHSYWIIGTLEGFTPRKYWLITREAGLCPDITEKLLTGTLSLNTNKP